MPQELGITRPTMLLAASGLALLLAGCHEGATCGPDKCADIPCGAIPRPAGVYSCEWQTAQIGRAAQDKFVVHLDEWYQGGTQLGPDGRRHMDWISKQLAAMPVIVETDEDEALNAPRQRAVIDALTKLGMPDAAGRVVVGYSEAEALYGPDAVRAGNARLGTTTGVGQGNVGAQFGGAANGTAGFGSGTTIGGGGGVSGFGGGGMGLY
jgi:hypothetical protein